MRVIIADDHPLFRDALIEIVKRAHPDAYLIEVGEAGELYAAVEVNTEIDLLLLDLNMPGAYGFSALIHLRALYPALPIVIVSARAETITVRRAMAHGAMGFIPKSVDADTLAAAIEQVLSGEIYDSLRRENIALSSAESLAASRVASTVSYFGWFMRG